MCGIFALLNDFLVSNDLKQKAFQNGSSRGPEDHQHKQLPYNVSFYFHRLAINGLDSISNQPITIGNITLICNGEIYNYRELFTMLHSCYGVVPKTHSDCEVIIHMYKYFGMEKTLQMLDGVFAFVLYETFVDEHNQDTSGVIYVARDPYGVRPLYWISPSTTLMNITGSNTSSNVRSIYAFASQLKVLTPCLEQHTPTEYQIQPFEPSTFLCLTKSIKQHSSWKLEYHRPYYMLPAKPSCVRSISHLEPTQLHSMFNEYTRGIYDKLQQAVYKRVVGTTERPIACLLSGGLDSSLIASLVSKFYKQHTSSTETSSSTSIPRQLETYSIGMKGSKDLFYARKVADHIGSKHTEIVLTKEEFFNAIPEVIHHIESYDTTSVRASVGNYLIGKYIAEHSEAKVIFNGDGSDELTGGYLYFLHSPNAVEFDLECRRLLKDIHRFDVLRSDASISSNGLEPRTPYLDKEFVEYYLSIPCELRFSRSSFNKNQQLSSLLWDEHIHPMIKRRPEKLLLRYAIATHAPELLPPEILWRSKEAFSDGVSGDEGVWYEIIQQKVQNGEHLQTQSQKSHLTSTSVPTSISFVEPKTQEQHYYKSLFDKEYAMCSNCIPYYWMPRFVDAKDASARSLAIYNEETCEIDGMNSS
jgi:asparagine synthase (glutamine-hydrolysing)